MNPYTAKKMAEAGSFAPHSGPLSAANRGFHNSYNRLIGETLAELGRAIPVVAMIGDDLFLLNDGDMLTVKVIPDHYHHLKALGHTAFGLQLWSMANRTLPLGTTLENQLLEKRMGIQNSLQALDGLPTEARLASTTLLNTSLSFISQVLTGKKVDAAQADEFARQIAPLVLQLATGAVRIELDGLHATLSRWRDDIGESNWESFYVVLCENHQPRYRHAARQYFGRLLREQEGMGAELEDRIIFAEGVCDIDAALDLLARHLVDQKASLVIFGDRSRLQRDLLADVATEYLDELLPLDK